jgi:hypothetical protein
MYQPPKLSRLGTLREVTLGGGTDINDPYTADSNDACYDASRFGFPSGALCPNTGP